MGAKWPQVVAKLKQDPAYVETFKKLYTDGITKKNVTDAIAVFEKSLVTHNSRFDKYLRGDQKALLL